MYKFYRMAGNTVQGSNDQSTWVTLCAILAEPPKHEFTVTTGLLDEETGNVYPDKPAQANQCQHTSVRETRTQNASLPPGPVVVTRTCLDCGRRLSDEEYIEVLRNNDKPSGSSLADWSRDHCPTCRQHKSAMGMPCNDVWHLQEAQPSGDDTDSDTMKKIASAHSSPAVAAIMKLNMRSSDEDAASGDDAAADRHAEACVHRLVAKCVAHGHTGKLDREVEAATDNALREIAALRAKQAEADAVGKSNWQALVEARTKLAGVCSAYDLQHKAHATAVADRDRLAAQVEELTRERDALIIAKDPVCLKEQVSIAMAEVAQIKAALAACQEERAKDLERLGTKDDIALVRRELEAANADLAAERERAEKAEADSAENVDAVQEYLDRERAARAEAEALHRDLTTERERAARSEAIYKRAIDLRVKADGERDAARAEAAQWKERAEAGRLALCKLSSALGSPCVRSDISLEDGVVVEAVRRLTAARAEAEAIRIEFANYRKDLGEAVDLLRYIYSNHTRAGSDADYRIEQLLARIAQEKTK